MDNKPSLPKVVKLHWLWAGLGIVLGTITLFALIVLGYFTRQAQVQVPPATPILILINAPTASITITPPTETAEPVKTSTPTLSPETSGSLSLGRLVEVYGTEGDGLRMRDNVGLDSKIAFLAVESEVFELRDGPVQKDGYEWWFLVNPYNLDKTGWAVSTYLRAID
ncbi:MAG: ABC transporter permease [Anaerolineales bacterium]